MLKGGLLLTILIGWKLVNFVWLKKWLVRRYFSSSDSVLCCVNLTTVLKSPDCTAGLSEPTGSSESSRESFRVGSGRGSSATNIILTLNGTHSCSIR